MFAEELTPRWRKVIGMAYLIVLMMFVNLWAYWLEEMFFTPFLD